jgi:hypothetical protein
LLLIDLEVAEALAELVEVVLLRRLLVAMAVQAQ